jgi:hypothetical protein
MQFTVIFILFGFLPIDARGSANNNDTFPTGFEDFSRIIETDAQDNPPP